MTPELQTTTTATTDTPALPAAPPSAAPHDGNLLSQVLRRLETAEALPPSEFPNPPKAKSKSNTVPQTIANVRHLLKSCGIECRYNVIKKRVDITIGGQTLEGDGAESVIVTRIADLALLNGISRDGIERLLEAIALESPFNPVEAWIRSRPWDRQDRLEAFYGTLTVRTGFVEQLKRALIYRWLVGAVAAALKKKDFSCRGVLTLQGPQGIGKTRWTRSLVSDIDLRQELIKGDHHLDPSNKDSIITATTHWIVEIGELDSSFKKDIARLKGFLTADRDKVRRPYGRADMDFQRRTVFCATVNESTFLVDTTGNTRFWTLPVLKVNYEHGIDMQQLFAQVETDFLAGEQWWLTPSEDALLEEHNKAHQCISAIRELVLGALELGRQTKARPRSMTASDVLRRLGNLRPTNAEARECGAVLRESLGEPTMSKGSSKWSVAINDVATPSGFAVVNDDLDDDSRY